MKTVTLAEARQWLSSLISEVENFDEHVLTTKSGRPTAVIVSIDEWEAIEDTEFWRSIPGSTDDRDEARRLSMSRATTCHVKWNREEGRLRA